MSIPRLELAQRPTPLQPLDRLSESLKVDGKGPRIWVKRDDLTGSVLSGNKIRKLEFNLAQALADGCDTVITCGGLQSNHCRATALLCAQLGLKCHLVLRGENSGPRDGNLLLDYVAGATVSEYPTREYVGKNDDLMTRWAEQYAKQGRKAFVIPTGASDAIGVWGYVSACEELVKDFAEHGIAPTHIVCATGSGGTQAGLTAGSALYSIGAEVIGMAVCDDEQWFLNKVYADLADWQQRYNVQLDTASLPVEVNDKYIGPGYAKAGPEIYQTIQSLAALEGLVLDPVYTGKAFHGLIEEIKAGSFEFSDDIVFIHTGGVFGLFPHKEHFVNG